MSDVLRKDPRAERILRNRLHPLHEALMARQLGETRGPTGLLRKNPHNTGYMGPNGLKRIDRSNAAVGLLNGHKARSVNQQVELPLHIVAQPDFYIMVVADMVGGRLTSQDKDILGLAHQLVDGRNGAVALVVFGSLKESQFDKAGVDRLLHFGEQAFDGYAPELQIQKLLQVEQQYQPEFWLFPESIHGGTDLGCRFAARIGERCASQVWSASRQKIVARGASGSSDIHRDPPRVMLLLDECAQAIDETRHEVKSLPLDNVGETIDGQIIDHGLIAVDPNAVPLAEAEFILSAGNGIDNWPLFHQTAQCLGATEGASRVAVDDGHMPRARQVGASGTWVTARVYVAVGISGAIQHMQGIGQCDKVIAINTDAGCDMVKRADLAVVADSTEILQALGQIMGQYQQQQTEDDDGQSTTK